MSVVGRRPSVVHIATTAAISAGLVGLASTAIRSWPEHSTPLTPDTLAMTASFSDYGLGGYLISAGAAALSFSARRKPLPFLVGATALGLGAVHASWIAPRFLGRVRNATGVRGFTILSQNLEFGHADPASLVDATQTADVVVLVEVTAPAVAALQARGWSDRFPHATPATLPTDGAAGTAVFSRFPLTSVRALHGLVHQTWQVGIVVPDVGAIELLAIHPVRPYRGQTGWRVEQDRLRALLPRDPRTVVAGDFNAVDSHRPIRALRRAGFRSSTELARSGWQPTFPANSVLPAMIEIDHVLLAPALTAVRSTTVQVADTDHLGVLARVASASP